MSEGTYSNDDGTDDDINAISDDALASNVNSTTTVLIIDSSKKKKRLKGLFDSGVGGNHVKCSALKNVRHTIEDVDVNVAGRYSTSRIT